MRLSLEALKGITTSKGPGSKSADGWSIAVRFEMRNHAMDSTERLLTQA